MAEEGLALAARRADALVSAKAQLVLGLVAEEEGDGERAEARFDECLEQARAAGNPFWIAQAIAGVGGNAANRGDVAGAEAVLADAIARFRALGHAPNVARELGDLGAIARDRGEYARAAELMRERIGLTHDVWGVHTAMREMAMIAADAGEHRAATRLFGAGESYREALGIELMPVTRALLAARVVTVRAALGEAGFAAEWAAGRALPLAEAVAEARQVLAAPPRTLADLRAALPGLRLSVDGVVADGDRAAVRVTATGAHPSSPLAGLVPDLPPLRHTVEVLRLARGKVAERWDQGPPSGLVQPLWEAALAPPPAEPLAFGLARQTLAPGATIPATTVRGPVLVRVEVGTLAVRVDGPATIAVGPDGQDRPPRAIAVGIAHPVRAGEVLAAAARTRYGARNAGVAPAEVLAMALVPTLGGTDDRPFGAVLHPSDATAATGPPDDPTGLVLPDATPMPEPLAWPPGIQGRYLVCLTLPALPAAGVVVTAGRTTLAPGASFRPLAVDGTALLTVGRGRVQLVHGTEVGATVEDARASGENRLGAGDAALVLPRTIGFARNGGDAPLVVVLVTITHDAT
jgi:hypothetical protein